jgi:hypothetical protein
MKKKTKKAKQPLHPLTQLRKMSEARMGRVMDSYPDPPVVGPYDFVNTFPVSGSAKGDIMYDEYYEPNLTGRAKRQARRHDKEQARIAQRNHVADWRAKKRSGEIITKGQGNRARAAANIRQGFGNFAENVKKAFRPKSAQMTSTFNIIPLPGGSGGSSDPSCVRGGRGGRKAEKRRSGK